MTIDIGPNQDTVEVSEVGHTATTKHSVTPGRSANIPVPNVPGGTLLYVSVGTGLDMTVIVVEVVEPK